tara:strand:- start:207 stop:659 length:453 start_codon:yes stop_codon:yes gene_type:complete
MTFSTATIQGYVNYKKASTTPQGRSVVNMLIVVPNKRQNGTTTNTYKVSVWDNQALAAAEYIDANRKQIITVNGTLMLDEYSVENPNPKSGKIEPMMRLDFASILDYGNTKPTQEQVSDKQKFVNMIDDVEEIKSKATAVQAKVKTLSKK